MPVPITLLVDDSCPLVHVFRSHWRDVHHKPPETADGRPLVEIIPNAFLDRFCDVVERRGMAGKFSIVPAPAGDGDIVRGIAGDPAATEAWLATVKRRLPPHFDFTPEGITHNLAVNLAAWDGTGPYPYFPESETAWSQTQSRETLTPYLTHQMELLREAGIDASGVTSPWVFGIRVEPEYIASIVAAQRAVYGRTFSWYFLHMIYDRPELRPWIAHQEGDTTLVAIAATVRDCWWDTIDSPRTDAAFVNSVVDEMLTEDGRGGKIREILDAGGWPVLLTHWQSLFSNGLESGLAVLDELGRRIQETIADEVEWAPCSEMARLTATANERAA
jgi:hypothetical protein